MKDTLVPTTTLEQLRTEKRDDIMALAAKHGISNVRVFGSVARGDDRPDSDIDFLIDLEKGRGLFDSYHFKHDLESSLNRQIDVLLEESLRPYTKPSIMADATPL
ncbi:MAG: nucleotidyltransferase family protein [Cyanobacteria bacterium J06555_13]